jgi:hypothetical protein
LDSQFNLLLAISQNASFSAGVIGFVSFIAKSSVSTAALASSFVIGWPRGNVGKADMQ